MKIANACTTILSAAGISLFIGSVDAAPPPKPQGSSCPGQLELETQLREYSMMVDSVNPTLISPEELEIFGVETTKKLLQDLPELCDIYGDQLAKTPDLWTPATNLAMELRATAEAAVKSARLIRLSSMDEVTRRDEEARQQQHYMFIGDALERIRSEVFDVFEKPYAAPPGADPGRKKERKKAQHLRYTKHLIEALRTICKETCNVKNVGDLYKHAVPFFAWLPNDTVFLPVTSAGIDTFDLKRSADRLETLAAEHVRLFPAEKYATVMVILSRTNREGAGDEAQMKLAEDRGRRVEKLFEKRADSDLKKGQNAIKVIPLIWNDRKSFELKFEALHMKEKLADYLGAYANAHRSRVPKTCLDCIEKCTKGTNRECQESAEDLVYQSATILLLSYERTDATVETASMDGGGTAGEGGGQKKQKVLEAIK